METPTDRRTRRVLREIEALAGHLDPAARLDLARAMRGFVDLNRETIAKIVALKLARAGLSTTRDTNEKGIA